MRKQHVRTLNVSPARVRMPRPRCLRQLNELIVDSSPVPGPPSTVGGNTGITNMYLMLAMWLAIAFLLFIFRPRTLASHRDHSAKPNNQVSHDGIDH
jgi:hypothetical protein